MDAATAKLTPLKKELACRLSEQSRECLVEVWEKVKTEIRECVGERGCRRFDCDFNETVTDADTQATLSGRISELRQKADELDAYFGVLVDEQKKLPANAAAAKKLVDDLATAAAASTGAKDSVRLYARAVVAEWAIANVWDGFTSIQNYLDCLCQILTCLLKVWKAIVALEGARAERKCIDDRQKERCDMLQADPVTKILALYAEERADRDEIARSPPPRTERTRVRPGSARPAVPASQGRQAGPDDAERLRRSRPAWQGHWAAGMLAAGGVVAEHGQATPRRRARADDPRPSTGRRWWTSTVMTCAPAAPRTRPRPSSDCCRDP